MATSEPETERVRIQTYVPEYQKGEWARHAEELDMSLSEFVRSMVQAGRRGFEGGPQGGSTEETPGEGSSASNPPGSDLEDEVLAILSDQAYVDWDDLLAEVTDDIEDRLDEVLRELQDDGLVSYSGRHEGYVLE